MSTPLRHKIFITHSWRDIDFARRLYNDLKVQGFEVWFDDKSMQAGHRMAEEINRGLAWCDVYVPVLSRASLASEWCWEEINAAITLSLQPGRQRRPRIISVLVEDCWSELPPSLASRLYINFTGRYEDTLCEFLAKGFGIDTAETERNARERVLQEKIAREQSEKEQIEREKVEQDRLARDKAEAERIARERTENERLERIKAETERIGQPRSDQARLAREKGEAERVAHEKVEQARRKSEQAEAERLVPAQAEQPIQEQSARAAHEQATTGMVGQRPGRSIFSQPCVMMIVLVALSVAIMIVMGSIFIAITSPKIPIILPASNAITVVSANPYETARVESLAVGKSLSVRFNYPKTSKIVDLFIELANPNPADISVFVLPNCDKPIWIGSIHVTASQTPRPVWVQVNREIFIVGDFCVQAQASAPVSLAVNSLSQYLVRVVVSEQ